MEDASSEFRNVGSDVAFVGDTACFDCHEDMWRGYQEHGMAQSYYPLSTENAVEDFNATPVFHEGSGMYYRMYEEDGQFFQEEYRLNEDGEKTHTLVRRMDYVIGSGNAARTYLTESNQRLYEMPVTWYTQESKWDFSPGYEGQNGRFGRLIPDRCMACHNDMPETVTFAGGKYTSVPDGIGCERCHGPGGLHVDERLASPEPSGEIDDTIVNPAHLGLDRQLDVCQQCHLHTPVSILRDGRKAYDFRPSEPLSAHLSLFAVDEEKQQTGEISVISHADRMKESECFVATRTTDNPMTCVTCHNPHEAFRSEGASYFNATCLDCHATESLQARFASEEAQATHQATADCISCHMPKVSAEDAPHSSFTDHWIRTIKDEGHPAPLASHEPVSLVPYFERDEGSEEAAVYEGMAYIIYGRQKGDSLALENGISILQEALAAGPQVGDAYFLLGWAQMSLGDVEEAIPALEEAVKIDADIPERLNALAQAYEATGRDPVATTRLYSRALSVQPALADIRVNYGRFLEDRGRMREAMEQYHLAVDEQPWLDVAHYNLGTGYLLDGNFEKAEQYYLQALELEPDYLEAMGNLGYLYVQKGELEKAKAQFERAVAVDPDNPASLGNLGTYLLSQNEIAEGIAVLERAVQLDPAYLDALLNLALAYFNEDDVGQARKYARQALQVDPQNEKARQILAAL